ncbi:DUF1554 domain-containing protein [Leptospira sp. 2 VSF19]|uniref:DUF1554 domain-containing protein n=1 Tax=Leptospira soteropolitanensis TaxID=2950025 RepID=A0AAW5VS83_9LEPT|nr:DUF1554 domain-containing protein [Leptospira soteropolitanensis]MCW7494243.1 DUF1554 domain-containing protein [Leptospira soteropolitanensis]MCW7501782.1 DUF1554 domain-containing protein [Leptospira soteropolitanensis]MCW7524089.1 DUF1554 domain-containing protein [Leptospira soteropolitanensis]MCW7527954.1 DUF1554 domain-containing protein [Leptospira soteropolitanensis]MCW7531752.1 DUF1554 domain-containing protein [Leptospira soteropolitanensis]
MRRNWFVSFLFLVWFLSCNQVNPRDELLFTLMSGLNPVITSTTVSVASSAKINVSSTSVLLKYGTPQNFGISLVREPTANVNISLSFTSSKLQVNSSNSPLTNVLTFNSSDYNVTKTVSLSSATQILDSSTLTITATSADPFYNTSGAVSISHIYMAYTGNSFVFQQGVPIPTLTPDIQFSFTSCSVTPSLPSGLSLNTSTCVISGTPTGGIQPATTYAVTATNGTNFINQNVSIQIEPNVYKVFVTAATYDGNLSGIAGADAKCNADANKPSTGTYKAMLTAGTIRRACSTDNCGGSGANDSENILWVFQSGRIYIRANDSASLLSPSAAGILPADGSGNFTTNPYYLNHSFDSGSTMKEYWTGFAQTNYWQNSFNCNDWTDGTTTSPASNGGRVGASNSTNYSALRNGGGRSCSATYYLLCVEQ